MTALTVEASRGVFGGMFGRLPSEISANPFAGSFLSYAADGMVHELVAGEPFAGISVETIPTVNAATADGTRFIDANIGIFVTTLTVSGAAADDVAHRRKVYATDDNVFTFSPASSATLIGEIIGLESSGIARVLCRTNGFQDDAFAGRGFVTLAATGNITVDTSSLGKVILLPSTGAQAITLPAAADCAGRTLTFKKTTADAVAATLTRAGADTIDGATTNAVIDAAQDTLTIISDGVSAWHIIAAKIA
jgi:hypothetical protein